MRNRRPYIARKASELTAILESPEITCFHIKCVQAPTTECATRICPAGVISYTSRLIDLILEMANSFLHLLQTQKRSLSLPRRYAGPSENVRCPACPDVLTEPELKLWSKPVPRNVVVPVPALAPAPVLAFKNFSFSLLPSSPKPTHRAREGGA
ncbi:hypothetical protein EDB89DRAFT_1954753 [Lactarius sanguifluus]|nr:hypothetical protein EDB89DRAFT_1954753 [Lactarius sanguifluus]